MLSSASGEKAATGFVQKNPRSSDIFMSEEETSSPLTESHGLT